MAKRVEFTDKDGNVKNMDKPLAMRLQSRKQGKITKVLKSANKNTAKKIAKIEDDLLNAGVELEASKKEVEALRAELKKSKKAITPPANKVEKKATQRNTK